MQYLFPWCQCFRGVLCYELGVVLLDCSLSGIWQVGKCLRLCPRPVLCTSVRSLRTTWFDVLWFARPVKTSQLTAANVFHFLSLQVCTTHKYAYTRLVFPLLFLFFATLWRIHNLFINTNYFPNIHCRCHHYRHNHPTVHFSPAPLPPTKRLHNAIFIYMEMQKGPISCPKYKM